MFQYKTTPCYYSEHIISFPSPFSACGRKPKPYQQTISDAINTIAPRKITFHRRRVFPPPLTRSRDDIFEYRSIVQSRNHIGLPRELGGLPRESGVKFVRLSFHERSEMKRLSRTNPALAGWWFRVPDTGKYRVQISDFRFQNSDFRIRMDNLPRSGSNARGRDDIFEYRSIAQSHWPAPRTRWLAPRTRWLAPRTRWLAPRTRWPPPLGGEGEWAQWLFGGSYPVLAQNCK
jgi:hypothetical protein